MTPVENIPEDELGWQRDRAVDRTVFLSDSKQRLSQMYVELDGIADDATHLGGATDQIRKAQQIIDEAANRVESEHERAQSRRDAIKERIDDE